MCLWTKNERKKRKVFFLLIMYAGKKNENTFLCEASSSCEAEFHRLWCRKKKNLIQRINGFTLGIKHLVLVWGKFCTENVKLNKAAEFQRHDRRRVSQSVARRAYGRVHIRERTKFMQIKSNLVQHLPTGAKAVEVT